VSLHQVFWPTCFQNHSPTFRQPGMHPFPCHAIPAIARCVCPAEGCRMSMSMTGQLQPCSLPGIPSCKVSSFLEALNRIHKIFSIQMPLDCGPCLPAATAARQSIDEEAALREAEADTQQLHFTVAANYRVLPPNIPDPKRPTFSRRAGMVAAELPAATYISRQRAKES
jgi:hypothetical protein